MAETGILAPDERVELLHGVVRKMSPKGREHVIAANRAFDWLRGRLEGRARVHKEDPLRAAHLDSEPEPDVMVCSNPDLAAYGTADSKAVLVIEVADSTLSRDLGLKAELYAGAGIPEYWVINLIDGLLEVFREPEEGRYRRRTTLEPDAKVSLEAWPDVEVEVRLLLP